MELTRLQVLDRIGEITDALLRRSIHRLLSEHEQMRRQLEGPKRAKTATIEDTPATIRRTGPHGAIRTD